MEKYDGVIRELAALLAPHIAERVLDQLVRSGALTTEINSRMDERFDQLGQLDRAAIGDFVRAELENAELITSEDLNDRLEDYILAEDFRAEVDEKIKDADLSGPVREVIRHQLTFSVVLE
jgi:hypothetical protein